MSTINLMKNVWLTSFGEEQKKQPSWARKVQVYEMDYDALALSCAWYRVRNQDGYAHKIRGLTDNNILEYLQPEDHDHAAKIRDYFGKRSTMWGLKGVHLSEFRKRLVSFIQGDGRQVPEEWLGLVYRLPEFHAYDSHLDQVQQEHFTDELSVDRFRKQYLTPGMVTLRTLDLIPRVRLQRRNRGTNNYDYWFEVAGQSQGAVVTIAHDNPLRTFWEREFNRSESMSLNGKIDYSEVRGFGHLILSKFNMVD